MTADHANRHKARDAEASLASPDLFFGAGRRVALVPLPFTKDASNSLRPFLRNLKVIADA